jgi:hypothetical protein
MDDGQTNGIKLYPIRLSVSNTDPSRGRARARVVVVGMDDEHEWNKFYPIRLSVSNNLI